MSPVRAVLLDVYETVLTCEFARLATELSRLAGVGPEVWDQWWSQFGPAATEGSLSMAEAYAALLEAGGVPAAPGLVSRMVGAEADILTSSCRVFADTIPLLEALRSRNVATALVSNCADNTRGLLEAVGLLDVVDVAVLSCEVGAAKPGPEIYRRALGAVGVPASEALFVDDQDAYCRGAEALGIPAVQIARRDGPAGRRAAGERAVITTLGELNLGLLDDEAG